MANNTQGVVTCSVCGKQYRLCPHCKRGSREWAMEEWRATACCPTCWDIHTLITEHFHGLITTAEALKRFEDAGEDNIDNLLPNVAEYIYTKLIAPEPSQEPYPAV